LANLNNYEFCADFAENHGGRVLDYGCGEGHIVSLLRKRGIDAYGCDVFFDGGSCKAPTSEHIHPMSSGIPFPDNHFDVVVNNYVMEHVENLDAVLCEIRRVLKPGGVVLSLLPDKGVWKEGHCGLPFVHWFRKSTLRLWYVLVLRFFGFGIHTEGKTRLEWAIHMCNYLDKWTHYRPYSVIRAAYRKHLSDVRHIEREWLLKRVGSKANVMPAWLTTLVCRKYVGIVFLSYKPIS
jgi:SAM-dependent methyltransferase